MLGGIVLVTFQNTAEGCSRFAVQQIAIHGSLESFELALVPGHEDFGVLNIGSDLQTRALEVGRMELGRVINHEQFWDAIAFPRVLDGWKLPGDIGLGEDRVFEAPHDSQTAWWFEAGIKTRWTTRVFIKSCGNRRSSQRQHGGVVHDYDVGWSVIHFHALEGTRCLRSSG